MNSLKYLQITYPYCVYEKQNEPIVPVGFVTPEVLVQVSFPGDLLYSGNAGHIELHSCH